MQTGIIPALLGLANYFEITGVVTRTEKDISLPDGKFQTRTITDLNLIDLATIDLIAVAVPIQEVPNVLRDLARFQTKNITLALDTPVLPLKKLSAARYFKNFREVLVLEDSIALPPFVQAKKLIQEGKIGKLKKITFFNSGYRYHALAALKFLAGFLYVRKIRAIRKPDKSWDMHIFFPGQVKALVIGPRDYNIGKFLIEGTSGAIADFEANIPDLIRINNNFANIDSLKIQGLMELLAAIYHDTYHDIYNDINHYLNKYYSRDGIYDHLAIALSEKFGWFWDFPLPGRTTFWKLVIKFLSRQVVKV